MLHADEEEDNFELRIVKTLNALTYCSLFLFFAIACNNEKKAEQTNEGEEQQESNTITLSQQKEIEFTNDSASFYYYKAKDHKNKGELKKAKDLFFESLKWDQKNISTLNQLAAIFINTEQLDLVEFHLTRAFECDSLEPSTYINYALYCIRASKPLEGIKICKRALKLNLTRLEKGAIYFNLGALHYNAESDCAIVWKHLKLARKYLAEKYNDNGLEKTIEEYCPRE